MPAKSAPQLIARHSARASLRLRTVLLLILAIITASVAWVMEPQEVQTVAAAPVAPRIEPPLVVPAAVVSVAPVESAAPADNSKFRALSEFLARRYRVSQSVTFDLVTMAHAAGQQMGLDPLLIIAVMAVESRFNPIAESVAGAKGLMQVIPKYHVDKFREFGGDKYAVFDPATNILVGSQILKDYLARTGSLNSALQLYVGATDDDDVPYIEKVMTEKQRLQQVLRKSTTSRPDVEASIPSLAGVRFASAR